MSISIHFPSSSMNIKNCSHNSIGFWCLLDSPRWCFWTLQFTIDENHEAGTSHRWLTGAKRRESGDDPIHSNISNTMNHHPIPPFSTGWGPKIAKLRLLVPELMVDITIVNGWLVVSITLKNISRLGWLFQIYGTIKNVPNHQPVTIINGFIMVYKPTITNI